MSRTKTLKEQDFQIKVGLILKSFRRAKKLTQKQVADMLGVSYQQIQKYEAGKNDISLYQICLLCKNLDVGINFFMKGVNDVYITRT